MPLSKKHQAALRYAFSLAFLFAFGASIFVLITLTLGLPQTLSTLVLDTPGNFLFLYGLIAAGTVFLSTSFERLKTLIHEVKHAVVVLLTGNVLRSMYVGSGTGYVTFQLFKRKKRYAPFILLAPYFFPLLSLPLFIVILILGSEPNIDILKLLLGLALGTDLTTAYLELHPHQTDLRRVLGGRFISYLFLLAINVLWFLLVSLWVVGGFDAIALSSLHGVATLF